MKYSERIMVKGTIEFGIFDGVSFIECMGRN